MSAVFLCGADADGDLGEVGAEEVDAVEAVGDAVVDEEGGEVVGGVCLGESEFGEVGACCDADWVLAVFGYSLLHLAGVVCVGEGTGLGHSLTLILGGEHQGITPLQSRYRLQILNHSNRFLIRSPPLNRKLQIIVTILFIVDLFAPFSVAFD